MIHQVNPQIGPNEVILVRSVPLNLYGDVWAQAFLCRTTDSLYNLHTAWIGFEDSDGRRDPAEYKLKGFGNDLEAASKHYNELRRWLDDSESQ